MGLTPRVLLTAIWAAVAAGAEFDLDLRPIRTSVGRFERVEFDLEVPRHYANPFNPAEIDLRVRLVSPSGREIEVPAFWFQGYEQRRVDGGTRSRTWLYPDGSARWKVRFAPSEEGSWAAVAVLKDADGELRSGRVAFGCVASTRRGFIRVSQRDPRFLAFDDGTAFFPIGQNLAFIGEQQYVNLARAGEIFETLTANGANYLRIWTCCEDWAMAIEARKSAWGRSWSWRPPIVADPDGSGRNCLKVPRGNNPLKVDPSHPVALRGGTQYVLSGWVRTDNGVALRLEAHGSRVERPLQSESPGTWTTFRHSFRTSARDEWLNGVTFRLEGDGDAWVKELSLKEASDGSELLWEAEVDRPVRGFYNPIDCFLLDEVVSMAERTGIHLQLCLITRDLYMEALKDPAAGAYSQAIADAKNLFRYAIARWGYSTGVAAWEYWNEMNPNLPTDRFYAELGAYLEQADPYRHLRTTSTWGPSVRDCRHAKLDLADTHFYLRPSDQGRLRDEVEAVLERTWWLREQAPDKPAHLGEFGLANDQWQPTEEMRRSRELVDFHNAIWASALSGSTGTALFWWWDRLDPRNPYPIYRSLSGFVADVPWTSGFVRSFVDTLGEDRVRLVGLRTESCAWFWLFNRDASWQHVVVERKAPVGMEALNVPLKDFPAGQYVVRWWDTREGTILREERVSARGGGLALPAPSFSRDIACRVVPVQ